MLHPLPESIRTIDGGLHVELKTLQPDFSAGEEVVVGLFPLEESEGKSYQAILPPGEIFGCPVHHVFPTWTDVWSQAGKLPQND